MAEVVLTYEGLLDAIFAARSAEQLQEEVRKALVAQLLSSSAIEHHQTEEKRDA